MLQEFVMGMPQDSKQEFHGSNWRIGWNLEAAIDNWLWRARVVRARGGLSELPATNPALARFLSRAPR
jgi:hypothetical protein